MRKSVLSLYLTLLLVAVLMFTSFKTAEATEVLPWGVERIRVYCVWDNNGDMIVDPGANAGQSASVAVIDTGIDYWTDYQGTHYHPDLADNVAGGRGFRYVSGEYVEELQDHKDTSPTGHGTLVAGTIAAVDNDFGVIGTAPKTRIYALKFFTGNYREVVAAINWAVNNGIRIISMSLGYYTDYPRLREAVDNAYAAGALLIAAAGNDNKANDIDYPARYQSVVAVGAVDQNLQRWVNPAVNQGSDMGPELEMSAPGANILSTWLNEGYRAESGTSMAVPHVTATAAVIWSSKIDPNYDLNHDGRWSNTEVREKLRHLALDLGPPGRDNEYGYGLINAWATNQRPLADLNIDYVVNLFDAVMVIIAFYSSPGSPNWDPRADINIDNIVDITDATIVSTHVGDVDP